ncbi:MAG: hypothetical protein IT405_01415 [Candidatus Yanofskybacteria bacterium]|nr:hypothetical protein [Candidatus Yanofskybacteria bacterium]
MPEPSTTELIQLESITDGVIILKDGSLRALVEVTAINFELRSGEEQAAILQQFAAFLNSVDFPVQLVVHSRRFDISTYLASVRQATESLTNDLLKVQAGEYIRFVSELSELANIMAKRFYIVLPLSVIATAEGGGFFSGITSLFKKKPAQQAGIAPERLASYKAQLQQRAELVIGGISGMGLKGHMLSQEEILVVFNALYNPVIPPTKKPVTP